MKQSDSKENRLQSSQRKMSNYIKNTLGTNQKNQEYFSNTKNTLNEIENQLMYIVKIKTTFQNIQINKECKEIRQSIGNRESVKQQQVQNTLDRQTQLVQTGNFGHPESQLSQRYSTQRTLPAFEAQEDIPDIEELKQLQNWVLDQNNFSVDQMDELKKLSSIILFRIRNIQKQQ